MALAGDHIQVLVHGYELTADSNRISIADMRDMHDVTAFSDTAHKFIPGQTASRLKHAGYMEAGAARSHPVLKGGALAGVISILLGQNTAPAVGDPVYSLGALQNTYQTLPEAGKVVPFTARFAGGDAYGGFWATVLTPPLAFTTSTNGSALDGGAATAQGGMGTLHVLTAAASDTYAFTIEGSATGAFTGEQTTLLTFALDSSARSSERAGVSGAIPRWLRWKAVRTGSAGNTVQIAVHFTRF